MSKRFQSFDTYCEFPSKEQLEEFLSATNGFRDLGISAVGAWISHKDIVLAMSYGGIVIV